MGTPREVLELPEGAAGIEVVNGGMATACPAAVTSILSKCGATHAYESLLNALADTDVEHDEATGNDMRGLKTVTRALAQQFSQHKIELHLCSKTEEDCEIVWFTFIDRGVNADYMPAESVMRRSSCAGVSLDSKSPRTSAQSRSGLKAELPRASLSNLSEGDSGRPEFVGASDRAIVV